MIRQNVFSRCLLMALVLVVLSADLAFGCPTCKDQLANDPAAANLARGYFYSILFMLSMPPLILTGLSAYFYWEVRRARRNQAQVAGITGLTSSAADNVSADLQTADAL